MPYDARIHNKAGTTMSGGAFKLQRGMGSKKDFVEQCRAEGRAAVAAQTPPPPPAPPVEVPPPPSEVSHAKNPPVNVDFNTLAQLIITKQASGELTSEQIMAALNRQGVTDISLLATCDQVQLNAINGEIVGLCATTATVS
jgi:hypothetical protein